MRAQRTEDRVHRNPSTGCSHGAEQAGEGPHIYGMAYRASDDHKGETP